MISSIRSANRPRGVHGVDDAEAYLDARYHGRHHRPRALAFTRRQALPARSEQFFPSV
jgi:hypothetical protein